MKIYFMSRDRSGLTRLAEMSLRAPPAVGATIMLRTPKASLDWSAEYRVEEVVHAYGLELAEEVAFVLLRQMKPPIDATRRMNALLIAAAHRKDRP